MSQEPLVLLQKHFALSPMTCYVTVTLTNISVLRVLGAFKFNLPGPLQGSGPRYPFYGRAK